VLKGLGYRMEKRPPMKDVPIIPIIVAAAAPLAMPAGPDDAAAPVELPAAGAGEEVAPPAVEPGPVAAETATAATATATAAAESAEPASPAVEPPVEPFPVEAAAEAVESADTGALDVSGEAGPEVAVSTDAQPEAVEPEMVEVWRPARHDRHPRGNRDANRGPRRDRRPAVSAAPGEAAAPSGEPGQPRDRQRWQRRDRPDGEQQKGAGGRPGHRRDAKPGDGRRGDERPKGDRPMGDRPREGNRPPRDGNNGPRRDRDKPRHDQQRGLSYQDPKPRDKQPDPNSPFAQLAALKAQLEAKK